MLRVVTLARDTKIMLKEESGGDSRKGLARTPDHGSEALKRSVESRKLNDHILNDLYSSIIH